VPDRLEIEVDSLPVPIDLPIRELMLELMRVPAELLPIELLVLTEREDCVRVLKEVDGREVIIRLDGALLELRLDIIVLDPDVAGVLGIDILLEIDVRGELLRVAALPRLKVLDLVGGFTERELVILLLPLRVDIILLGLRVDVTLLGLRLDVIVRERLTVGVLLEIVLRDEILREAALLRLGVLGLLGLLGALTVRELALLRLLLELADALALGAGAGLETCALALLLLDFVLFLELFAAKTGSVARAKSKRQKPKGKIKEAIPPRRALIFAVRRKPKAESRGLNSDF
jgi:hypothetical protein